MITIYINTSQGVRQIQAMVASFEDMTPVLATWNKYFRQRVQEKFDAGGPGWPKKKGQEAGAPAPASDEAIKQLGDEFLRRKLRNELKRAARKYARGSGSAKAMERRYAVLQEFERIVAGGPAGTEFAVDARLAKSVKGLRARHQRATAKAEGRPLGRIAQSIKSKLSKYDVTVYSEIPWAGVHNDGGVAGHGAVEPKRQFLDIDDKDIEVLVMLIEEHTRFSV